MSDATIQAVTPLNAAAAAAPVESKIKVEVIEVKGPGLVQKVWNYCNLLRDDGVSRGRPHTERNA